VLVSFPSAKLAAAYELPEGQGFTIERADPEGSGELWLALTRKLAGSPDLFTSMACDVVGALDDTYEAGLNEDKLLLAFIGRVGAWQEFMRKGTQVLGPEAEIGIIGELMVLLAIITAGLPPAVAVESWVGPLNGIRDFELGVGALEVKATLAAVGFPAKIGSLEQLDDSIRQPLFVAGVRLRQAPGGESLPMLVEKIRQTIDHQAEARGQFADRLLAAGYLDAHSDRYVRRFEQASIRVIEVGGNFPRLTPGTVPTGVIAAMYEIDLDRVHVENLGVEAALKRMGVT
jgi:hypothetical protein